MSVVKNVRSAVNYWRHYGAISTVGKTLMRLGQRLNTPPRIDTHYPDEVAYALEDKSLHDCISESRALNRRWCENPLPPRRILWLMPDFRNVHNGGPNTIIRFANHFARQGIYNTLYIFNGHIHSSAAKVKKEISEVFGENDNLSVIVNPYTKRIHHKDLPDSDIAVATLWHTAYLLLPYKKTRAKYYFVQDYERLFYSAGVEYKLADLTYDFGYFGIFNTPGLQQAVTADHTMAGRSFVPGIDRDVFYPSERSNDPSLKKLFFYGRPEVPRNGFSLGISGLAKISQRFPETTIYIAGHHASYPQMHMNAKFLDYLPYQKTGDLYRNCGGVVSFMFTPHPSYIPLQSMACGTIPIALHDPYTAWALKHEHNSLLINPVPEEILEAYIRLRYDRELRETLRANAIRGMAGADWRQEMDATLHWIGEGCPDSQSELQKGSSTRAA